MTAPRGRGKSALAGMFAHKLADVCCITAPAKAAVDVLRQLKGYFSHMLLTTTVAGYEGTRRGFLLKFCDTLPRWLTQTLLLEDANARVIAAEPAPPDTNSVAACVAAPDGKGVSTACRLCGIGTHVCRQR